MAGELTMDTGQGKTSRETCQMPGDLEEGQLKGRAGHPKTVARREPGLRLSDLLAFCLNAGAKTQARDQGSERAAQSLRIPGCRDSLNTKLSTHFTEMETKAQGRWSSRKCPSPGSSLRLCAQGGRKKTPNVRGPPSG